MKELDYLDSTGDDLDIQYAATLDELVGLDKVKAISNFSASGCTQGRSVAETMVIA